MRYPIYARKSSEAEERQVQSIGGQIEEMSLIAQRLSIQESGLEVLQESKSAKFIGRPIFNSLLDKIKSGDYSSVLVWHPDRLSRNPQDSAEIIALMDAGKLKEVITPTQTFKNNPMDKFMLGFLMMQAKLENDTKGVNVKRGLKTKAERGWLPSGAKPGYMNDKNAEKGNKTVLSDPIRFPLIRRAWEYMLTGTHPVKEILGTLNDEWGYRTPQHKRIGGKPMSRSMIYKMFSDPFYYGEYEYAGEWYKGLHEKMITKEEFDKVQLFLGGKGRPRPKNHTFIYSGLLRCGECNATITAEEKYQIICSSCKFKFSSLNKACCPRCNLSIEQMDNPKRLHYVYYHCTKRKNPACTQCSIRLEDLEKQFDSLLNKIQISERFKNWAIRYLSEFTDKEVENRELDRKATQKAYDQCVQSIDNLIKLKISDNSLLSNEEFKSQKESLISQKNRLKEKLAQVDTKIENSLATIEKTFDFACNARYWFEHGSMQEKREILASLGSNMLLKDKIVSVNLEKPLQFIEEVKKEIPAISEMLEPGEKVDNSINFEGLWMENPSMLRGQDSNLEP